MYVRNSRLPSVETIAKYLKINLADGGCGGVNIELIKIILCKFVSYVFPTNS